MIRKGLFGFLLISLVWGGCASPPQQPRQPIIRTELWDSRFPGMRLFVTENYHIHTDLGDLRKIEQLANLMEKAKLQYRRFLPLQNTGEPLRLFLFSRRDSWAAFTIANTGEDAPVFLQMQRGAYAIDDWWAAHWIGDRSTFALAAHEGWHQYVARQLRSRMPPALEEGMASMFENIQWNNNEPTWHFANNLARSAVLKDAIDNDTLWPLEELLRMHAGDVISLSRERIDLFYAQCWALATMLTLEDSPYRPAIDRYFSALASGNVYHPPNIERVSGRSWNRQLAAIQLEHYLMVDMQQLQAEYLLHCRRIASRVE